MGVIISEMQLKEQRHYGKKILEEGLFTNVRTVCNAERDDYPDCVYLYITKGF